jgi:hypothetical protein
MTTPDVEDLRLSQRGGGSERGLTSRDEAKHFERKHSEPKCFEQKCFERKRFERKRFGVYALCIHKGAGCCALFTQLATSSRMIHTSREEA